MSTDRPAVGAGGDADPDDPDLGRKGWVLVAAVVVAVLIVPLSIYLWPAAGSVLGANYRSAMLVLPMLPAILLGVVAVWSMTVGR
ncbi:MAG: hypothetical protein ABEJ73_05150 [Haloplanus sp.]